MSYLVLDDFNAPQGGVSYFVSRFLIGLTAEKLNKIINKIKIYFA